ncbi:hypothetical protein [Ktedonospora formicarum]|uniref:hypothetical protein n=1 Tax=Ktedonospora formicarum TaxID=2778364 RepID=UPI001C68B354|nr:hypothetical protein [Ktedonospora formicarum]
MTSVGLGLGGLLLRRGILPRRHEHHRDEPDDAAHELQGCEQSAALRDREGRGVRVRLPVVGIHLRRHLGKVHAHEGAEDIEGQDLAQRRQQTPQRSHLLPPAAVQKSRPWTTVGDSPPSEVSQSQPGHLPTEAGGDGHQPRHDRPDTCPEDQEVVDLPNRSTEANGNHPRPDRSDQSQGEESQSRACPEPVLGLGEQGMVVSSSALHHLLHALRQGGLLVAASDEGPDDEEPEDQDALLGEGYTLACSGCGQRYQVADQEASDGQAHCLPSRGVVPDRHFADAASQHVGAGEDEGACHERRPDCGEDLESQPPCVAVVPGLDPEAENEHGCADAENHCQHRGRDAQQQTLLLEHPLAEVDASVAQSLLLCASPRVRSRPLEAERELGGVLLPRPRDAARGPPVVLLHGALFVAHHHEYPHLQGTHLEPSAFCPPYGSDDSNRPELEREEFLGPSLGDLDFSLEAHGTEPSREALLRLADCKDAALRHLCNCDPDHD